MQRDFREERKTKDLTTKAKVLCCRHRRAPRRGGGDKSERGDIHWGGDKSEGGGRPVSAGGTDISLGWVYNILTGHGGDKGGI